MGQKRPYILTLVALLTLAGSNLVSARTLYFEMFDGPAGEGLDGRTPAITTDGATWQAGATIGADGTLGSQFTAILPFTPETGTFYELTATFENEGDWAAIGFLSQAGNVGSRINDNAPLLWSLTRPAGASNFDQAFLGPGTGGGLGDSTTSSATELKIRIDTISVSEWVVTWFYDGVQTFEETVDPQDYDINFVAFGVNGLFTPMAGAVTSFRLTEGLDMPYIAASPYPADEATDVRPDVVLSWLPGELADTHDVYFGAVAEDVNNASRENPLDVLIRQGQDANAYEPSGPLELGVTYYWRIDEVNAPATPGTYKGTLWSFTVEPYSYQVPDVNVSANIADKRGSEIENIVNGSGLLEGGGHSTADGEIWAGMNGPTEVNIVIDFAFDRVYKLDKALVWNYNSSYEYLINAGIKDITIEYSTDGNDWAVLGDETLLQGHSDETTMGQPVDMNGVTAQYVRFLVNSNYGRSNQVGLSEVQFYYLPTWAREPKPEPGSQDVDPSVVLRWRPGREATMHEVHLGTDANAVAAGQALADVVAVPSYAPLDLMLSQQYYWMITEVNEAETPMSWDSEVWDFSTPDFIIVDNMESYNDDEGTRIFDIWLDGYGVNSNGSLVGHDFEPFAEETIVHSGDQSMPFRYGENGATTSQATLTLPAPENWTRAGVNTLVIWFRGSVGNATGQLYAKINGSAPINYTGSAASLAAPVWKQWNIDLTALGNAAQNVTSLTLGVSGSGRGQLYFDDIRLYGDAPPQTGNAVDPGTNGLAAYYPMSDNVSDASGNGRNGTTFTGVNFGTGPSGYGRALVLDGVSGYAELPLGPVIQSSDSITIAAWVNWNGADGLGRIFDFGTGETANMWMAPDSYGGLVFAITIDGFNNESRVVAPDELPTGWRHVTVTIDGATSAMNLYLDGNLVDTDTTQTLPSALGDTTQNWIGRSQYAADPYLGGSVDEFRIYTRALSAQEIQYLVGDR